MTKRAELPLERARRLAREAKTRARLTAAKDPATMTRRARAWSRDLNDAVMAEGLRRLENR